MRMRNHRYYQHHHGPSLFSSITQALNINFHAARDELDTDPQAAKFDLKVAERLSTLELVVSPTKNTFTLAWINQALLVVTTIISEAQSMIPAIQRPLTQFDELWVSGYLEDTCRLLDVLNTLRKSVGDLEHRLMLLHLAVSTLESKHGTEQERKAKARDALDEFACPDGCSSAGDTVKSCCGLLREMLEQRPGSRRDLFHQQHQHQPQPQQQHHQHQYSKEGSFLSALYAAKVVAVFVLGVVLSLFSRGNAALDWPIPVNFAWSRPLRALLDLARNSLQVKVTNSSPLLEEFAGLEREVKNLREKLDSGRGGEDLEAEEGTGSGKNEKEKEKENKTGVGVGDGDGVQKLKDVLKGVEAGMDRVKQDMDKLFYVIVGNRNSLLSCLRGGGDS